MPHHEHVTPREQWYIVIRGGFGVFINLAVRAFSIDDAGYPPDSLPDVNVTHSSGTSLPSVHQQRQGNDNDCPAGEAKQHDPQAKLPAYTQCKRCIYTDHQEDAHVTD
mmetsp:Transcript_30705/g.55710  ORF Transcript_30705/g.55710 Transcript_30705/m.55710 type:complete len:108 (-) Transcript_30705:971-1294(-)